MSNSSLPRLVGKPVKERYGRYEGTVIAAEEDESGEPKSLIYENGGVILRTDVSGFRMDDGVVEVGPATVYTAEDLYKEISTFIVRQESLDNLRTKGVVTNEIYGEVRDELKETIDDLMARSEEAEEKLEKRLDWVEDRQDWIYRLFMDLEMVRKMKQTSPEAHSRAYEKLEEELFAVIHEGDEIKRLMVDLTSITNQLRELRDTGETSLEVGKEIPIEVEAEIPQGQHQKEEIREVQSTDGESAA